MANLQLNNLTKIFNEGSGGEIVAVEDVSIDINDGEFLVLVGPSGCGKSTTLRMIAGLETVTSGEINLGEKTINDARAQERDIAMVFQSYALYPHLTVRKNMSFGLEQSTNLSNEQISRQVEEVAEMLGISDLIDRKPGELSGGQQQRVALGRAIVRDPEVFLMDEPLSNLDAKLRGQMRTELQTLQDDLGVTTVYVTHDQTEAMTMGDRIAVLDGGELQQCGTPLECYHKPNNQFVAGFIGDPAMNFFEAALDGQALNGDGFRYPLSEDTIEQIGDSDRFVLGIRPEDIELRESEGTKHDFEVVVDVVEPRGDENTLHLRFSERENGSEQFTATINGLIDMNAGEQITVRIPEAAIHVFDADTGAALRNRELNATRPNSTISME
ncbi:sugar ABC transporter ATP-binding protein [Haloferax sp. Atlit-4N]|uniref:ABC transporter ATP-binding protein n=1 Tax=unclassified Haloferax TaxID=2625095 RepID=UPI000E23F77E|nr:MULTISPECIES: ABC transporter ATP-binding protein [unclassified Haloferax]RDZ39498.1 sugar ABC transporter ATP-binding protein [Haloferax sp. Atlit-19N]RDZ50226.1 sugar ABC transporter ATP-binding protein [Haloferax sp. Atlit-4N]